MPRYEVYGYYTDDPQVVIDIVDAENDEAAVKRIEFARGGPSSGYTSDGAQTIEEAIANTLAIQAKSAEEIERGVQDLAKWCRHDDIDGVCQHRTFYWINRRNLNWRCTDECGFQFFGHTVTEVRRRDKAVAREAR